MSKCQCSKDFPEEPFAVLSGKTNKMDVGACEVLTKATSHAAKTKAESHISRRQKRRLRGSLAFGRPDHSQLRSGCFPFSIYGFLSMSTHFMSLFLVQLQSLTGSLRTQQNMHHISSHLLHFTSLQWLCLKIAGCAHGGVPLQSHPHADFHCRSWTQKLRSFRPVLAVLA